MKRVPGIALLVIVVLITGCDPGFTVRQVNVQSQRHSVLPMAPPQVTIEVSKFHALIGSGHYAPKILVTNMSELPIVITRVELVTGGRTYSLSGRRSESAQSIDPGATRGFDFWLDLNDGLQSTFKKPAELRVHYTIGNSSQTASARLVGKVQSSDKP